jgi:FkbM family methyltransferase
MNWQRFLRKCKASKEIIKGNALPSFSQVGEDIIVNYLFQALRIQNPTYLDIGTNLPVTGNNTYFFYNRGSRGVCIEPDPELFQLIRRHRPKDKVYNAGIGLYGSTNGDLYIFPHPYTGWNTFSKEEAQKRERETGIKVKEVRSLPLKNINEIMSEDFGSHPNFISIDVEGLDLDILKSLNFDKYLPEIFCVETITFSLTNKEQKIQEIIEFMQSKGYFVYADTHVNTIFCNKKYYES